MLRSLLAMSVVAALLAPLPALAHSHERKGLEIVHPWTFATPERSVTTTVVSMTIKNLGPRADRLIRATTPIAAKVEMQEPAGAGGGPKPMAAVQIEAGASVELSRKGPHLVVSGLKKRLNAYDSFKLTLIFEQAGRMVVEVMVEEAAETEPHKH